MNSNDNIILRKNENDSDSNNNNYENRRESITNKNNPNFNLNDNMFNDIISNTIDTSHSKNIFYNQYKTQENNYGYYKSSQIKENRNIFNLKEDKIINKRINSNVQPKITKNAKKESDIIINLSNNLQNKARLIRPTLNNDYFKNYQFSSKLADNNNISLNYNSNTIGNTYSIEECSNNLNKLNTINNIDSYIKVNKVDKFIKE